MARLARAISIRRLGAKILLTSRPCVQHATQVPGGKRAQNRQAADRDQKINPPISRRHWLHVYLPMTGLGRLARQPHSANPCQPMHVSVPAHRLVRTGRRTASWAAKSGNSSPCKIAGLPVGSGNGLAAVSPCRRLIVSSPRKSDSFPGTVFAVSQQLAAAPTGTAMHWSPGPQPSQPMTPLGFSSKG